VKIAYLLIQMPAPSEVFLAVEIRGLIALGNVVKVAALRRRHPDHERLVEAQKLRDVELRYFSTLSFGTFADIFYWTRRSPLIVLHMLWLILHTCWRLPPKLVRSLAILPKSFSIARYIEAERFDVVHVAWGHFPSVTAYLINRLLPDLPFTLALGAYDRESHHPFTVIAANRAQRVLTQSETTAERIRNDWPCPTTPVQVIYRGIEVEDARRLRDALKIPGLIVSAARLVEFKGHQYLIRAMPKIRQAVPTARLNIYGTGLYQPELERLIAELGLQDVVTLGGHVAHEKLFREVAQASVFALASEKDRLPNSVKEAMALGTPVVTTFTEGMGELVRDDETGLIVPSRDVDAIAEKIIAVLTDAALAARLRSAALDSIDKFDVERTSQQRHQLYLSLIRRA
jgi:glycosyltransferase involved in cell wall biosynthesis